MTTRLHPPDYSQLITPSMEKDIKSHPFFLRDIYANLDVAGALDFFTKRFVLQLPNFTNITKNTTIADVGTGIGWLSISLAMTTDAKIIAIEPDLKRLEAAQHTAKCLHLENKILWSNNTLGRLPFADNYADIVFAVEMVEHLNKSKLAMNDLCRICRNYLIITTPNLWFPIIKHDTRLPFCHWLPLTARQIYATLAGRADEQDGNLFWSPISLKNSLKGFKRISNWLHYANYQDYLDTFPYYLPYAQGQYLTEPGRFQKKYYDLISPFGKYSHIFSPNLAGVFQRIAT